MENKVPGNLLPSPAVGRRTEIFSGDQTNKSVEVEG